MKKCLFLFRFLLLIQLFIYNNNQITSKAFDPSLNMILFDDTCVYVDEINDRIYKMKVTDSNESILATIPTGYERKTLIKISDDNFILFAINSNSLFYYKGNKEDNNEEYNFKELNFQIPIDIGNNPITFKYIEENSSFLFYYNITNKLYLHLINQNFEIQKYDGPNPKDIPYDDKYNILNNIECDSHDGEYIFCAYSTIYVMPDAEAFRTIGYYSFINTKENFDNQELKRNIAGPALLKVKTLDNKKKFLICYYEFSIPNKYESPTIYCQYFIQNENKIIRERTYLIGTAKSTISTLIYNNFVFQNVIYLHMHKYTIYINVKLTLSARKLVSAIYISPLDFNFIIPYYLVLDSEKINILLSDEYILFLTKESRESTIKIESEKLTKKCPERTLFNINKDNEDNPLTELYINTTDFSSDSVFISFGLDYLTNIYTDDTQNPGDLLYMYQLKDGSQNIILKYNENLKITYNYYIYHSENIITSPENIKEYLIFSQFCLLKVLNCYESCKTCNENIIGTEELHQCSSCKNEGNNKYYEFHFAYENEKGYFNCYKEEDKEVKDHYYLDPTNKYLKCDDSCESCKNGESCEKCNIRYYFKEDKLTEDKCYDITPSQYYLDETGDQIIYRKCYKTCETCFGKGNDTSNQCISCLDENIPYPFDYSKCTQNKDKCKYYWKIDDNLNVQCIDTCDGYIITEGNNKNQCVKDCKYYIDPFNLHSNSSLYNYTCKNEQNNVERYCITLDFCKLKKLHYNSEKYTCQGEKTCINVSDTSETPLETDELDHDVISERTTIVKYFDFKVSFADINDFIQVQMNIYISELIKELNTHEYQKGINLITINIYEDFKITLYPLYIEDYFHENVSKSNNLGFFHFYEEFKKKYSYSSEEIKNIIVGLVEFIDVKYPINSINYFFFNQDRDNDKLYIIEVIDKEKLVGGSSLQINIEYPLKNFNNPNIVDSYSSKLLDTVKTLNLIDQNANFFDPKSDFYTDICTPFTSEIGTDMTLHDRTETYTIQVSLCEKGCQIIDLVDKGEENPRSLCQCNFKTDLNKNENYYSFIYEKTEGKDEANINVLKCGSTAFNAKVVDSNFVFWFFIFFIIIFAIVAAVIYFCGKNSVEEVLKIKKVVEENENENERPKNKENIYNMSEKISSVNSEDKYQSIDVKDNRSNSQKGILSSKISYAAPPKKQKDTNSTKENNHIGSGVESINTTINLNNKIELKFKNDEEIFDEIFPDYNEALNNNIYENKYMKNNYINLRLTNLKLKKYFLSPIENDELVKHNNTDNEDNLDDLNYVKYKSKKSAMFDYYQSLLPKADISKSFLKNHYKRARFNSDENINNNDNTKNLVLKNSIKFFEDSDFLGDEQINNNSLRKKGKTKLKLKNSDDLIYSSGVSNSSGNFFLNSQFDNKIKYNFLKFYWLYLNKREFYLVTVYNLNENLTSFIRLTTFIFVISLQFTFNCLLLTEGQIHERHLYKKEHGSLNEFTYVFQKESGIIFADVFIFLIIKMLFIKFIYERLFRISQKAKEDLSPFVPEESEKDENEENVEKKEVSIKTKKRNAFIKKYNKKSLIYIGSIFAAMILLFYISVCYIGTFKNTKGGVVLRFIIAVFFSVIFCAILCLIVVTIYHYLRKTENKYLKMVYNICRIVY